MLFPNLTHRNTCISKQEERRQRIADLDAQYHEPSDSRDDAILAQPVATLVANVQAGRIDPSDVLMAYGKKALKAHAETNCLTEIMISSAEVWAKECNRQGPLAGIPVSLKDMVGVEGWDACIGYSSLVGRKHQQDSPLVRLLRDAGAVPFVKTNLPMTLLSFESYSDVFGRTTNPHKKKYSPGGSTGGEAALLAYGGSRIGIGTDVAGSLRVPAHYSGIYSIRASAGRFMKTGILASMPGQEGIPQVCSPMARTLEDLETFWKAVVSMEPWKYDQYCLVMPWRSIKFSSKKPVKWGVMWDDEVVVPSPACRRALEVVVNTLRSHGHDVVSITPPSPYEGLKLAAHLLLADGGKTSMAPVRWGESLDAGVRQIMSMFSTPRWIKRFYTWYIRYIKRDEVYAGLIEGWHEKTVAEYWPLVAQREDYRRRWFGMWQEMDLDFVLTVPNALPAVPHNGMKEGFKACGYSFLFNLLDYTAGVLPITHVHAALDRMPLSTKFKPRNMIEKGVYKMYDAVEMHGLPVGVQVVGRRLEEEKVMEGMKIIEQLLRKDGMAYELLKT
ncbi:amidase signature domain-containing protein [Collybia nuda]|uniref:amidase n=1 Tax=Collybia nuda TaxID=64659 RepID=A0A9P5XX87_9AGAR|nr:amidase signature domain-containing protein [Collybia nuda]